LVTTRLASSAGPKVVERVGCITTPGETIDAIVTEVGVAVNPMRPDLKERLVGAGIEVIDIRSLHFKARQVAPVTAPVTPGSNEERVVGILEYRDGTVIDVIRRVT
jgi:citrate lyase subunit alpha/citrate CoA-transferase